MRIFREVEAGAEASELSISEALSRLRANLAGVRSIVAISSARGGVGKSAIAVNVATSLALAGRKVGIIDADLNSPSIVAMLGMKPVRRLAFGEGIEPGAGPLGLRVAASNLIPDGEPPPISFVDVDQPVPVSLNGNGPVEISYMATLRRLLGQTRLGALDLLLVDLAPGIESVHRFSEIIPRAGLILVSHPSDLSARATKGLIELAAQNSTAVIGIIENMAGFNCDGCHAVRPLLPHGGIASLAREAELPVIGRLPFDPRLAETSDRGVLFVREYPETPLAKQLTALAQTIDRSAAGLGRQPAESTPT